MSRKCLRVQELGRGAATMALFVAVACAPGCGTLGLTANRESIDRQIESDPKYSIAGVQGPTERGLRALQWNRDKQNLAASGDAGLASAYERYEAAMALYESGKYAESEKQFHAIAKERRDTYESFGAKWNRFWGVTPKAAYDPYSNFGDPVEEDALFMRGQAQFAQMKYAAAQDTYDELLNRYPSTRHLDSVTRQMFRIARYWLGFPDGVGQSGDAEVKVASAETANIPGNPPERTPTRMDAVPILPNFTDKTRPMFDTFGRGELALRSIWLHDATGPLADDALMLAANHNLRQEDFVESARLYKLLREQYPDSPHLKDAYLLGSHVSLASYEGPSYDSKALEDSLDLKRTMLQVFPDLTPEDRERLQKEVELLQNAEIARYWDLVEFYQAKRSDPSVALHCHLLINRFPDSEYAERAREVLAKIDAKRERQRQPFWSPFGRRSERSSSGSQAQTGSPGASAAAPQQSPDKPNDVALPADPGTEAAPRPAQPRLFNPFGNMLRRAEQPPKLQPTGDDPPSAGPSPGRATLE